MSYSEHFAKYYDPLCGLGDEIPESKYYRVDNTVFAEPLDVINSEINCEESTDSTHNIYEQNDVTDRTNSEERHTETTKKRKKNSNKTTSPVHLEDHSQKDNNSEKKFVCEVCGARFSARYLLKRHSAVHGLEKVQCPVCKKMLSLRTNLSVHLRSHAGTRPHACGKCGKRFLRRSTLALHARVHAKRPGKPTPQRGE